MGILDILGALFEGNDRNRALFGAGVLAPGPTALGAALMRNREVRPGLSNQRMPNIGIDGPAPSLFNNRPGAGKPIGSLKAATAARSTRPVGYDNPITKGMVFGGGQQGGGVPASIAAPNNYGQDTTGIESFLSQFFADNMVDPSQAGVMAQNEYGPQLQAIAALQEAARNRNTTAQDAVGDMYGALANAIRADAPQLSQVYDSAKQNIGAGFDEAKSNVAANYDESAAGMEAMMRRLGLEEAAPSALAPGAEGRAQQTSLLDQQKSINTANQDALKSSALDYNTDQAQNAGFAGANAQADLTRQLNDILAQAETQRLNLMGQQAGRETDLFLQLSDMNFQRERSAAQFAQELMNAQARAMEDAQGGGAGGLTANQQFNNLDPWGKIHTQLQNRGYSPQKVTDMLDFVRDQISMGDLTAPDAMGREPSPAQIATRVRANNRQGSGIPSHEIEAIIMALADAGYFG